MADHCVLKQYMLQLECFGVKGTDCTENKLSGVCIEVACCVSNSEELNIRLNGSEQAIQCFPNVLLLFCY